MSAEVRAQIERLRQLRERVAVLARQLAERELDARLLKLGIEGEHRQAGATQTAAEREARVDPSYIAHERATAALGEEHGRVLAECEALRFGILLALAERSGEPVVRARVPAVRVGGGGAVGCGLLPW